jgi:hypothetical protein
LLSLRFGSKIGLSFRCDGDNNNDDKHDKGFANCCLGPRRYQDNDINGNNEGRRQHGDNGEAERGEFEPRKVLNPNPSQVLFSWQICSHVDQ